MISYEETMPGGARTIVHNDRVAFTTTGKLVNLLPAAYDYSGTIGCYFADPPKSVAYMHQAILENYYEDGAWHWGRGSRCVAWISVPGREWSQETILCPLPSPDVDFIVINARFVQTAAPSHLWCGKPVIPMIDQNVAIPFTGSVHLESADPGLQRMASIVRSGSNLVLHQQETIVNTAANFGSWEVAVSSSRRGRTDWRVPAGREPGLPVWADTPSPWRRNWTDTRPDSPVPPLWLDDCDMGRVRACSIPTDPTNYGSAWAITIHAMFGTVSRAA